MARGGFRPGAGRPKKGDPRAPVVASEADAVRPRASLGGKSPLEYMLDVMNDSDADEARRDRMAVSAAPFVHMRAAEAVANKKDQRQAAADDAATPGNKFAPPSAPKLVISNK